MVEKSCIELSSYIEQVLRESSLDLGGAYCNVSSLPNVLVSNIEFVYKNICIYLVMYISICFVFYMKAALYQRQHRIFSL